MPATQTLHEATNNGLKLVVNNGDGTGSQVVSLDPAQTQTVVVASQTGAMPTGENHIGAVGGNSVLITPSIAVDTAAYSNGDSIGGKITLAGAIRVAGGTGVLQSIMLLDRDNEKPALEIIIFDSDPTAATITNNAAFVFSTDDLKVLGRIPVAATDWVTLNGKATAAIRGIGLLIKAASGTSLYAAIVLNGSTPTFTATTDFQARFGILQD